jgi:hypothetical protein
VAGLTGSLETPAMAAAKPVTTGVLITNFGFVVQGVHLVFAFRPGPASIQFGTQSIVLRYSEKRSKEIDMSPRGGRLKLYVYSATWPSGVPREPPRQVQFTLVPIRNPLTQETYDYLVGWAKSQGLRVEDRPWSLDGPNPTHTVLVYPRSR